jgi:uroporphyrinogen III methyltransferase/synthase
MTGGTVLVTREEPHSGPLTRGLVARGFRVQTLPLLATLPPVDPGPLEAAAARLAEFDWVVATSARGADALLARIPAGGPRPRLAVVGAGTARPFRAAGWSPEVTGVGGGVDLAARMRENVADLAGAEVLLPGADRIRPETIAALEGAGAKVTAVTAYRTAEAPGAADALRELLAHDPPEAVAFTSPSAVEVFAKVAGDRPAHELPHLAAIGRTTADALAAHGWTDAIVPPAPGLESLAEALADALASER